MQLMEKAVRKLKEDGYCRLHNVYSKGQANKALEKVKFWYERCKDKSSKDVPYLNIGQPTLYNLQAKEFFFLELLFEPQIIENLLIRFLNDQWYRQIPSDRPNYVLRSYIARSSKAALPMHIDSLVPYLGAHVFVMQYSIILENQNSNNGCTILVPRSHLSGKYATQESREDAIAVESEIGDIVIWDSRTWHGTTENRSGETRWSIVATFCRWWLKQHFSIIETLPQEFYEKLTDSHKAVLGFCSYPLRDEVEGIDIKRGYDSLRRDSTDYAKRFQVVR